MFHVSLLKNYCNRGDNKSEFKPAAIVLEPGSEQEFEMERILEYWCFGHNRTL